MAHLVGSETCRGCLKRAAADGTTVHLAGTGGAEPEALVRPELRPAGAP